MGGQTPREPHGAGRASPRPARGRAPLAARRGSGGRREHDGLQKPRPRGCAMTRVFSGGEWDFAKTQMLVSIRHPTSTRHSSGRRGRGRGGENSHSPSPTHDKRLSSCSAGPSSSSATCRVRRGQSPLTPSDGGRGPQTPEGRDQIRQLPTLQTEDNTDRPTGVRG